MNKSMMFYDCDLETQDLFAELHGRIEAKTGKKVRKSAALKVILKMAKNSIDHTVLL